MARVAVVTGGTRGIGLAITQELHAKGYKVAASYAGNDEAAKQCAASMPGVKVYKFDVGSYEACEAALKQIEADLGPVDVLVNNAGITRDAMLHRMKPEQWSDVIRTNLDSLFNMTRPLIDGMRARGFGRIISISSINGQKGQMGQTNYSAAKAAVIGFTKALAAELAAKGVTVNAIAPGYVATKMVMAIREDVLKGIVDSVPMKRLAKPEEIGYACAFLANELSGFTTGATLNINGGLYYQ